MILKIKVQQIKVGGNLGVRCHQCGHLLFILKRAIMVDVEIKCHQCKEINTLVIE